MPRVTWFWTLALGCCACSPDQRWLPFPELSNATTRLLLVAEDPPVGQLLVEPTVRFETDSQASLFLLGFDQEAAQLGLTPGLFHPQGTPPRPGESDCSALAKSLFRTSLAAGDGAWVPVGAGEVPKGFLCQRLVPPEEECLSLGRGSRVLVSTTSAAPGAFEFLPDGRVLLTLADRRVYAVDRSQFETLPQLERFLQSEGYAILTSWIDDQGRYWFGGSQESLALGEWTATGLALRTILPARPPGPLEAGGAAIASLNGSNTAQGVELYATTNTFRVLRYREGDQAWEPLPLSTPVPTGYAFNNVATLTNGQALAALAHESGVLSYDAAADPPLLFLRDPDPRDNRPADFVLADGDGFIVTFPGLDRLFSPKEVYRLLNRRWQLLGFVPASDNGTLGGVLAGDSILLSQTNGQWVIFPSATRCPPERFTVDGAVRILARGTEEVVVLERFVPGVSRVQVVWQAYQRTPAP